MFHINMMKSYILDVSQSLFYLTLEKKSMTSKKEQRE